MKIEVLGIGCPKCRKMEENARKAVKELGIKAEVFHVYDAVEIARRGIVSTPALVVDGKVKVAGRVPTVEEIKQLLK